MRRALSCATALLVALSLVAATPGGARDELAIEVVSGRADLVSGGDALIGLTGAALDGMQVDVDGRDVTDAFVVTDSGRVMGLVDGLAPGENVVTAVRPDGIGASLTITNHAIGGPLFSGPQLEPWICTTAAHGLGDPVDEQCNGETIHWFVYKSAVTGRFQDYDPESPPDDGQVATTTTDEGETVPYIVRRERGTANRGIYDLAVLWKPGEPWTPWAPQSQWNHKVGLTYGSGCAPGYSQASPEDPMIDDFIGRGFVVGASSIAKFGNACNMALAAESAVMLKERITETLGPIRYTIGNGCSGGAEAQHTIAESYPGLLDGIRPECTFADGWTPALYSKADCYLLEHYLTEVSPHLWTVPAQRDAVIGHPESQCLEMGALGSAPQDWDPTTGCNASGEGFYDPVDNPIGTRCTLQDHHRNVLGTRESDGFANGIIDHVGIQWGLQALYDGMITVEQFLDLNENIGGFDIDFQFQPERSVADLKGLENFYRSGQFSYGTHIAEIPNIDGRTDNIADFHGNVHRDVVRARVVRAAGHHDNQVYWFEPYPAPFGLATPFMTELTLDAVDEWLAAIEQDEHPAATKAEKARRNKPDRAVDDCYAAGQRVPSEEACDAAYGDIVLPRIVAGMPLTADVLKCQLKPLREADYLVYGIQFTGAQWARLNAAFPDGVCDWSRPGVGQRPPIGTWLSYDVPGGRPLGAPPVSRPVG